MQMNDMILVSVDDHVCEPPDMWKRHLAPKWKDRAPRFVTKEDGTNLWVFEGGQIPNVGLNAVAGRPPEEYGMEPTALKQLRPGCYDVDARIGDMNANGVLGSLCFPTVPGFVGVTSVAFVRSFSDTGPDSSRLFASFASSTLFSASAITRIRPAICSQAATTCPCVSTTPFGGPVVPLEGQTKAGALELTVTSSRAGARPSVLSRPLSPRSARARTTRADIRRAVARASVVATITDARGNVALTLVYDGSGRVSTQKDARGLGTGETTTFSYATDGSGNPVTTVTSSPTSHELTFSPTVVDTYNASGWLVSRVVEPERLLDLARELANEIASNTSAVSVALSRQMLWRMLGAAHPMDAHEVDSKCIYHMAQSADAAEGVKSFFEKRPPQFTMRPSSDMPPFYPWWPERRFRG